MNVIDTLVLANLSIISAVSHLLYLSNRFPDSLPLSLEQLLWIMIVFGSLPMIGLVSYVIAKVVLLITSAFRQS